MKTFRIIFAASIVAASSMLAGCGDVVANEGNLGNLVYALFTDYNVEETELSEALLITGVEHRIMVTEAPGADVSGKSQIAHRLYPDTNSLIETSDSGGVGIGDAILTVNDAGDYTLQSWNGNELVDYIELKFVDADKLDVMTFLREPDQDEFGCVDGNNATVPLYSQVTFLAAPVDIDGNRLVGDIGLEISVSPVDSMIQVYNLDGVYENEVWESSTPMNMLFVEPGDVVVTLTEPLTGLTATVSFTVTAD